MGRIVCPICDQTLLLDQTLVIKQETFTEFSVTHKRADWAPVTRSAPDCFQSGFTGLSFNHPLFDTMR